MGRRTVWADTDVNYGARVLVRGCRASLADQRLANATVVRRPSWCRDDEVIEAGYSFSVEMDPPSAARDLQALADGPIMDSNELYLPAGKLSMAETRAREAAQIIEGCKP